MTFFLDENFPKAAATLLAELGHPCIDPRGTPLEGASDESIILAAIRQQAVLLTTDRDFFHTIRHQHPDHAGVVVITLRQPTRIAILSRLNWFVATIEERHWRSRVFLLRDDSWIARPPMSSGLNF